MSDLGTDARPDGARRRRLLVIVAVAALALVVAVVAVLLSRPSAEQPVAPGSTDASAGSASSSAVATQTPGGDESAASSAVSTPAESVPPPSATGDPTVVPTGETSTTKAPIDDKGDLGNGVEVSVSKVEKVKGEAQGPGEVAGPALRITIKVENGTDKSVSMALALANLYYGKDAAPASPLSGPGAKPLSGSIKAGKSATGTYVFGVPEDQRDTIQVEFSYTTDAPTVIFEGAA